MTETTCLGMSVDGKPCKRKCREKYCWQHWPQVYEAPKVVPVTITKKYEITVVSKLNNVKQSIHQLKSDIDYYQGLLQGDSELTQEEMLDFVSKTSRLEKENAEKTRLEGITKGPEWDMEKLFKNLRITENYKTSPPPSSRDPYSPHVETTPELDMRKAALYEFKKYQKKIECLEKGSHRKTILKYYHNTVDNNYVLLTNTFKYRDIIKKCTGYWDKSSDTWIIKSKHSIEVLKSELAPYNVQLIYF